jgi:hypothetical protein
MSEEQCSFWDFFNLGAKWRKIIGRSSGYDLTCFFGCKLRRYIWGFGLYKRPTTAFGGAWWESDCLFSSLTHVENEIYGGRHSEGVNGLEGKFEMNEGEKAAPYEA